MEAAPAPVRPVKRQRLVERDNIDFHMNHEFLQSEDEICDAFSRNKNLHLKNGAEVQARPFPHCVLPHFIKNVDHLANFKDELEQLKMKEKNNDLYQFKQSEDLGSVTSPYISGFMRLLKQEVRMFLENVTNIALNGKIDSFCSFYNKTDHLLCHDDQLEERKIAFIFYLVPEWSKEDGGLLDLFKTERNQPTKVVKSVVPEWNKFVFFKVSPISFHQVSEVLSCRKRIAVGGWFHGYPKDCNKVRSCRQPRPSISVKEVSFRYPNFTEIDITQVINPMYLDGPTQLQIRQIFEEKSEISLPDFFRAEFYEGVCKALKENNIQWIRRGPVNHRLVYEAKNNKSIPPILKECQEVFRTQAFSLLLSNFTALNFHPESEEGARFGKVFSCVRKWSHGAYTLLHDQSFSDTVLNAIMYFNCPEWNAETVGGSTSFVISGDKEELLQSEPVPNTLSLIYVTEGTSHFVKYVNCKSKEQSSHTYHDIYCMYIEDN